MTTSPVQPNPTSGEPIPPVPDPEAPDPEVAVLEWAAAWAARPKLRGWQHAAAIAPTAAVAGLAYGQAHTSRQRVAVAAWGAGLVTMLSASAAYHRLPRSEQSAATLRRLDHAAIFAAVAGTWTPIALAVLPGSRGVAVAAAMWGLGGAAAVTKVAALEQLPRLANLAYLGMGWAGLAVLPAMRRTLGPRATGLMIAGGAAYSLGAIAHAAKGPDLHPDWYGYHELWHTATLVGAGLHGLAVAAAVRSMGGGTTRRRPRKGRRARLRRGDG